MAFDSLDIEIGGSVADAKAAIGSVKSSLFGLESSANDAQDSIEELGDETTQTTGRLAGLATTAGATATSMVGLSTAGTGASSSMAALGVSVGTTTTAIVGLSAVAAPLAATLGTMTAAAGGLATAFGAIVGSGLLAFGEEQAKVMEDADSATEALAQTAAQLKQRLVPLIAEFGQRFIPLIQDAINGIVPLTRDILNAIGPLDQFRQALRDMGGAAANAIPTIVSELVGLGRRALPVLRDLIDAGGTAIPQAFDAMIRVTERVGDDLLQLGSALVDLLPELTALGVAIIETVTPALTALLDGLEFVIGAVVDVGSSLDQDMIPLLTAAGVALTALATGPVGVLGAAIAGLAAGVVTDVDRMKRIVRNVINGDITAAFNSFRTAATNTLTDIRTALVGEGGDGGILINAIRQAGSFLRNEAVSILRNAIRAVVDVGISTFNNLKIALIGESGQGGLLNTIITEYVSYLQNTAPQLVRTGYQAVGQAIGTVVREIYNLVTGNGDSVLRSIIKDFVAYLQNDAVDDLMTGLEILKDIMIQGAVGLAQGFANGFGNISFQPLIESFNSVANTINGFIERINSQFGPINIGARVPTVSGDILEGGIDFGDGSGGTDGSGGIDFDFDGSDGSDSSGDSGSDGDFGFDFGSDTGSGTNDGSGTDDGATGSEGGEEMPADDVDTSPNGDTATIGADFGDNRSTSRIALYEWARNRNLGQRVVESFWNRGDVRWQELETFANDSRSGEELRQFAAEYQFDEEAIERTGLPIMDQLRKRAEHARDGTYSNITDPLSDDVNEIIDVFPSISASDIPTAETGGFIDSGGLSMLHAGERVVPEAQVSDRGPAPVEVNMDSDAIVSELRQLRQSVESGDTRISDRDLVRGLERLFDRHGGAV